MESLLTKLRAFQRHAEILLDSHLSAGETDGPGPTVLIGV